MGQRLQLQSVLKLIADNVYFQPPNNIGLQYPCIIYERSGSKVTHAGNLMYLRTKSYLVTVIDQNPDSDLPDKVEELPMCKFDRFFIIDTLNHHVFTLFY